MKVYTKTGDAGETSLLSKQRVSKDHIRVETYGTVDEANAAMGLAKSFVKDEATAALIEKIQKELISLNADLATEYTAADVPARITPEHVQRLEQIIDRLEEKRIPQNYFVTPGSSSAGAAFDLARTIVRRAERCVVRLKRSGMIPATVPLYLNRLSDLLFVLARCVEQEELVQTLTRQVLTVINSTPATREGGVTMLEKAKKIIEAAEKKAVEIKVPMVIAVVDAGGNLVAQHRMDGALIASIAIARDKAYTAVALQMPTDQAALQTLPGQPLYGLNTTDGGRLVIFGGGYPIYENGAIVGGLGVSGGAVEEDMAVARAGLAG
ncbi:haem-degrading [Lucifera butyrica]|uniref:Corrinoid adenosyltransferase n=1 Tax=Lucifera butyrica TaxID=1351585 RepID=A0A498R2C5_9FIRM|nr:cob(I)yrinic acid a,c-diamide adenosyltransferase [Lucifera butyrica]VBB05305.1 haem-degrading [Lucifera butyrica]